MVPRSAEEEVTNPSHVATPSFSPWPEAERRPYVLEDPFLDSPQNENHLPNATEEQHIWNEVIDTQRNVNQQPTGETEAREELDQRQAMPQVRPQTLSLLLHTVD